MALLTLPNGVALCVLLALTAYVIFGGADFGGGVWDGLASGPRKQAQRDLIANTIGPIWEANHVWLILVIVLLFVCFPRVFSTTMTYLNVPISLMLIGIVLRGSAFTFRAYDVRYPAYADGVTSSSRNVTQQRWGRIFATASTVTPIVLGICVGTVAAGELRPAQATDSAYTLYIAPWLAPFPIACGILALALFAFLAAVYLTVEADDNALREDFRRRALLAAAAVFFAALGALAVAHWNAPHLRFALTRTWWAVILQTAIAAAAVVALVALTTRHYRLARIAAPAQVSLIVWGWAASQYPYMIPGWFTVSDAAAPDITLRLTLFGLLGGAMLLVPSLWYLFRVFNRVGEPAAGESGGLEAGYDIRTGAK